MTKQFIVEKMVILARNSSQVLQGTRALHLWTSGSGRPLLKNVSGQAGVLLLHT